ncbi:MAG: prolipoprotein diacylglyceryl transferase [Faecalibacterium sp.]|nr:prolipoprotein diacylglyceryl transferase [Faecalibacterium sp.]
MNLLGYLLSAPNNVAFTIGRLTVQWYGLILTSAMVLGLVCIILLGKEQKIKSDDMITLFLYIIPLAVIFARLVYVIVRPEYFPIKSIGIKEWIENGGIGTPTPENSLINLLAIWEGGITIVGGVIGGLLGGWLFSRKYKIKFSTLADICVPVLLMCQAIGRWGNYMNQEAYGLVVTDPKWQWFPFAVYIDAVGEWHLATFFYAFVINLLGALAIYLCTRKNKVKGLAVFMYLAIYCTKRFFMEFIRLDAVKTASGIGVTQIAMLIGALIGVVGGILYYKHGVLNLKRAEIKEEIAAAEEKAIAGKKL